MGSEMCIRDRPYTAPSPISGVRTVDMGYTRTGDIGNTFSVLSMSIILIRFLPKNTSKWPSLPVSISLNWYPRTALGTLYSTPRKDMKPPCCPSLKLAVDGYSGFGSGPGNDRRLGR